MIDDEETFTLFVKNLNFNTTDKDLENVRDDTENRSFFLNYFLIAFFINRSMSSIGSEKKRS